MKVSFIRPGMMDRRLPSAMQPLAAAVLAGLAPPGVELELIDEFVEPLPEKISTDLAALSVQTFTAARAYRIADRLRRSGIPVVMGGYHPTLVPDEAAQHADAVVVGEAEPVWARVLDDFARGVPEKMYRGAWSPSMENTAYDRSIFKGKDYIRLQPVECGRGCPLACEFCSVSAFHRRRQKVRPVEDVAREVAALPSASILFVDDNMFANLPYARQLLRAIRPLQKKWGCQIGIAAARNDDLLAMMADSGCVVVMIGFESLVGENLRQMDKRANLDFRDYAALVRSIKKHGIMVYGSFVFGYDHDTPASMGRTLEFALDQKLLHTHFNSLNPMPGTRLLERLRRQGRLVAEQWWLDDTCGTYGEIAFHPAGMSARELKLGCKQLRAKFSSLGSIARRLCDVQANARTPLNLGVFLAVNWIARREIKLKMEQIL